MPADSISSCRFCRLRCALRCHFTLWYTAQMDGHFYESLDVSRYRSSGGGGGGSSVRQWARRLRI